jgi:hypothetical protein
VWTWDFDQGSVELDLAFNVVQGYANPIRYEKLLVLCEPCHVRVGEPDPTHPLWGWLKLEPSSCYDPELAQSA